MSLVASPLNHKPEAGPSNTLNLLKMMELGQHLIAVLLTVIGAARAINAGVWAPAAIGAAFAVFAWHTAGVILTSKSESSRAVALWLIGFFAVWVVSVAVSPEFVWVAFLLWLLAGHLLPLRWGIPFSILIFIVVTIAPIMHSGETQYANIFGPLIGGVFAFGISRGYLQLLRDAVERERLVTSLKETHKEMADLQVELALSQRHSGAVAERTRISRDIHDTIAQVLSSIRLLAHAETTRLLDEQVSQTLKQIETLAAESLTDVRRIIAALTPSELESSTLTSALKHMIKQLQEQTDLETKLQTDRTLPTLSDEAEIAFLRAAQSAIANVRLHSHANKLVVSLTDVGDFVRLDVVDDGVGFDASSWEEAEDADLTGYGLRFMRDRMRELGGGIDVASNPGVGTSISAFLPLDKNQHKTNFKEPQ
ncbi:MAG TPA: sensor histidine kinase [Microbacteriaceae bacterium]|nr:sensor histidine kinase [Microbacteriaceae bacterium]